VKQLRPLLHPDAVAGFLVVVGAALVTGFDLAEIPAGWIVAGTSFLTGAGVRRPCVA
jgi:hypothetical protein